MRLYTASCKGFLLLLVRTLCATENATPLSKAKHSPNAPFPPATCAASCTMGSRKARRTPTNVITSPHPHPPPKCCAHVKHGTCRRTQLHHHPPAIQSLTTPRPSMCRGPTTLGASTSHTSQLDTSDKQIQHHASTNPNHYLERKHHIQHHETTFNNSYKRIQHNCASIKQQQHKSKDTKKIDNNITHYIMYSNLKSDHHLLAASGASSHVCPKGYAPDLPLRPCGESVPQLYTATNQKIPLFGIKYVPTSRTTSGS